MSLAHIVGSENVLSPPPAWALHDATEWAGLKGSADALVRPGSTDEVAQVVAWCAERGVPVTPRGGGTGLAGGCVPDGGVVLALDRLDRVVEVEPETWRMVVGAGVTTAR
ncbi:MAG: glycolate oxidase, partial [Miltoncostaeaceae bacterium]|nr:glycolate oxidase [Miltoncostaeaceae bacterium]